MPATGDSRREARLSPGAPALRGHISPGAEVTAGVSFRATRNTPGASRSGGVSRKGDCHRHTPAPGEESKGRLEKSVGGFPSRRQTKQGRAWGAAARIWFANRMHGAGLHRFSDNCKSLQFAVYAKLRDKSEGKFLKLVVSTGAGYTMIDVERYGRIHRHADMVVACAEKGESWRPLKSST